MRHYPADVEWYRAEAAAERVRRVLFVLLCIDLGALAGLLVSR